LQYYSSKGVQSYSVQRNDSLWGEEAMEYIAECAQAHDIIVLMSNGNIGGLRNLLQ
jgi:UDP-N-acetylmuramate-alanine ligase